MKHRVIGEEKKETIKKVKAFKKPVMIKQMMEKGLMTAAACMTYGLCQFHVFAMSGLDKTYTIADTTNFNPESMILNLAFWISRLVGIGMLVWGIYGYVTARKDGEAESMNGALGKLISGCVLIAMPSVMKGLGILS